MSSKNKRMASRQSRIRERRRRGGGRGRGGVAVGATAETSEIRRGGGRSPQVGAVGGTVSPSPAVGGVPGVTSAPVAPQVAVGGILDSQAAAAQARITRRRAARTRAQSEPLPMYAHLRSELLRIAALTALMAVALAILTVFLR